MPILRLIEAFSRLSISCHLFYLFPQQLSNCLRGQILQRTKTDNNYDNNNNNSNNNNTMNSLF